MYREALHINPSGKFDTAYINPCIDRVLEAIGKQLKGSKVLLVFENPLIRTDQFQLTEIFPLNWYNLKESVTKNRLWNGLFQKCPHLVQPQKVIYSHTNNAKTLAKFTDILLNNHLNTRSEFIDQSITESFSFVNGSSINGVIFQEYKINVSRVFIELLKYFELIGGKVLLKAYFKSEDVKAIIQCQPNSKYSILLPEKVPSNFLWVVQRNKKIIRFMENSNQLQIDTLNALSGKMAEKEIIDLARHFVSIESYNAKEVKLNSFLSVSTLQNIQKTVKDKLPNSLENTVLKDNYELSLEKFDIAKQTGITYPDFKVLFHRYGNGIDEMTDLAYEKMNSIRDPQIIWNEVEQWYQRKYEWMV